MTDEDRQIRKKCYEDTCNNDIVFGGYCSVDCRDKLENELLAAGVYIPSMDDLLPPLFTIGVKR